MQLVDRSCREVLSNRRDAAAEPYVSAAGRVSRLPKRAVNAVGHEMKRRSALHRERRTSVMREDEDRHVIRRFLAPPAFPGLIGPRSAHGTKHVSAENPRANA